MVFFFFFLVLGQWYLTAIYSFPKKNIRSQSWDLLRSLCRQNGEAWLVIGDFNELMYQHEKKWGKPRPERQLTAFKEVIEECHQWDLGYSGPKLIACNRRAIPYRVSERIDRFLLNSIWWDCFPRAWATHGVVAYSDHLPIWVVFEGVEESPKFKKLFKFEAMWVGEPNCEDIIKSLWSNASPQSNMSTVAMIKDSGTHLGTWNRHTFGNV
ncbi:hypothetical protein I3760_01G056800 [Carya illinoinensis]|nr:hypothetical protein I3760_01G056800 [Carya illinoinensis]